MRKKVKNFFSAQINHEQNYRGIFEITLSCFLLSIVVALVRHLNQNFHIFFIVMMRNLFGLIFLLPQFIKNRGTIFQTKNIYLHPWFKKTFMSTEKKLLVKYSVKNLK